MNLFEAIVRDKIPLTDKLFNEISDIDIYCELSGIDFEIGKPISSPLRDGDDRASFSLFIPTKYDDLRPEELWWRDFAGGSGDIFKFVKMYADRHYDVELRTRKDVIVFLDDELNLGIFDSSTKVKHERRVIDYDAARESKEILFTSRDFTDMDKFWWSQYGIDEALLNKHDVRSVRYLLNEDYSIKYTAGAYDLIFAYVIYDKVKVYSPYSDVYKWRNTCPSDYIMGEEQRTGEDVLIITKSMKDLMVFKSFIRCDSTSPQAETNGWNVAYLQSLKSEYTYLYVVMDYDDAGRKAAEELEKHGFIVKWVSTEQFIMNGKTNVKDKDISDYVKNNGVVAGLNRMKEMFNELPDECFKDDRVSYLLDLQETYSS